MSLLGFAWFEILLTVAFLISTGITLFILTLPSPYSAFEVKHLKEEDFTEADKSDHERSGYDFFHDNAGVDGKLSPSTTATVVVLGDIGRSPRMQYHALSIAARGGKVNLVGYTDSEVHPNIQASRMIDIVPITPYPSLLQTSSKALFPLIAPLKVLWQVCSLYHALAYKSVATKWMLVQNPPSIPTLAVAQFVCLFRKTRLIVDWHNFGFSILALRLGPKHMLVRVSEWYEGFFARGAFAHLAVTSAMCKVLKDKWKIDAQALHDRPPKLFQPLSQQQASAFLASLPDTAQYASDIKRGSWRLVVSSTSWTPDEDFSIFLSALAAYSSRADTDTKLPKVLAIITGKGPQKEHYLSNIRQLKQTGKLRNVVITTAWLSAENYASLLGSADLGISLHKSSSGVDLPMKVVDMFGAGLPVAGFSDFAAWPELVREGSNGRGFNSSEQLANILQELLSDPGQLEHLRQGALKECEMRWDDEWNPVAGKLLQ